MGGSRLLDGGDGSASCARGAKDAPGRAWHAFVQGVTGCGHTAPLPGRALVSLVLCVKGIVLPFAVCAAFYGGSSSSCRWARSGRKVRLPFWILAISRRRNLARKPSISLFLVKILNWFCMFFWKLAIAILAIVCGGLLWFRCARAFLANHISDTVSVIRVLANVMRVPLPLSPTIRCLVVWG